MTRIRRKAIVVPVFVILAAVLLAAFAYVKLKPAANHPHPAIVFAVRKNISYSASSQNAALLPRMLNFLHFPKNIIPDYRSFERLYAANLEGDACWLAKKWVNNSYGNGTGNGTDVFALSSGDFVLARDSAYARGSYVRQRSYLFDVRTATSGTTIPDIPEYVSCVVTALDNPGSTFAFFRGHSSRNAKYRNFLVYRYSADTATLAEMQCPEFAQLRADDWKLSSASTYGSTLCLLFKKRVAAQPGHLGSFPCKIAFFDTSRNCLVSSYNFPGWLAANDAVPLPGKAIAPVLNPSVRVFVSDFAAARPARGGRSALYQESWSTSLLTDNRILANCSALLEFDPVTGYAAIVPIPDAARQALGISSGTPLIVDSLYDARTDTAYVLFRKYGNYVEHVLFALNPDGGWKKLLMLSTTIQKLYLASDGAIWYVDNHVVPPASKTPYLYALKRYVPATGRVETVFTTEKDGEYISILTTIEQQ